jgi:DNA-binding transcriptional ArsR family regulator
MPVHSLASHSESLLSQVAAAIAEPARTRMLCCLMDGHARTATELGVVAKVSPSTASVHLAKLKANHLVDVVAQGKHRYFRLSGPQVGAALESLLVLAGATPKPFVPSTPSRLRGARTCYDHLAGTLAVALHDHMVQQDWLQPCDTGVPGGYQLSTNGETQLTALGVDVPLVRAQRRRFACACMDWSERKPHTGGAIGAALLNVAMAHGWLRRDLDSRAVELTGKGRRAFQTHFAIDTHAL